MKSIYEVADRPQFSIAIVGSRNFEDYDLLDMVIKKYCVINSCIPTMIVSGGAKGADQLGERFARENGIETLVFLPEWDKYGKRAGHVRNRDIVQSSDVVFAFWDGKSPGTKGSIDLAISLDKHCIVTLFKY